ncbi:MAG: AAA family ATPase [Thermoproteota archaeon]
MHLARIEIRNFKSILDRQVINLSKGLTVITGRNGSGKCVAPWTPVARPWGGEPIESIFLEACQEGTRIYEGKCEYIIPRNRIEIVSCQKSLEASVNAVFRKPYDGFILKLTTSSGRLVEVTPEHRLAVAKAGCLKWVESAFLKHGDKVLIVENGRIQTDIIDKIEKKKWKGMVYDLYVKNVGSYVIGNGIIVHNSNLVDAIRFALGENNPRLLRTDRLSSLVNDNAGRDSEAYVKITIDNSDSVIPGQGEVITIARKMGRDGESTYYLNGRKTPRNVIEDIISTAGLSARGYNIILQGEISRLADKNPVERRKEIEQALGLAQYDEKKMEALNNLQQADNNLRVAQARLQEIDRRMFQLERERNLLLRRRMLEKEIERVQLIIDSLEYWRLIDKLNDVSKKIEETIALKNKLENELIQIQSEKRKLMEKMEELLRTVPTVSDSNKIRIEYELKDYERQLNQCLEKIKEERGRLDAIKKELKKVRKKRNRLQRKIKRLSHIQTTIMKKHASTNALFLKASNEKRKLYELEKKTVEEILHLKSRFNLIEKEIEKITVEEKSAEKMLKEVLTYYNNIKKKIRILNRARERDSYRRSKVIERLVNLEKALAERRKIIDNTLTTLKILTESIDAFRIFFAKISGALSYRSRSEREKAIEIVKKTLEEKGLKIYGILRECIIFPENIRRAVESIAGEWMDSILVENSLDMLVLINLIGGRINDVKILTSEGEVVKKEVPVKLYGRGTHMMDLIKYPKSIEKHVSKIFWNSVLAKSIEDALVFTKHGFKAVTLDGRVFTSEGASIPRDNNMEFESLLRFMKSFTEKAGELSNTAEKLELYIKHSLSKKILETTEYRNKLEEELNVIDMHINEIGEQLNVLANEYLSASRKISQIFRERNVNKRRMLEKELERLKTSLILKEEKLVRIRRNIRILEEELEELESKKTREKESLMKIENIVYNLQRRLGELKDLEKAVFERLCATREEITRYVSLASQLRNKIETLKAEMSGEAQIGHEKGENERDILIEAIRKLDEELEGLNLEINRVKDAERRLLVEKEINENKIEELKRRINNQPLSVPEEIREQAERYLKILREEVEKVQEVNMLAIKQYEEEVDFYRNALERINELEEERRSIQEFMEDIERRKREAFLEGLSKINSYFSTFFNKMTGGEGWLQPEDPDNPLETGLNVYVKFPGKEARIISGVSGGEKSVAALCLIFAMQKLFPAAFYIFDEPDAHLDYVNIEKMTELLREVSKDSQIIVISLRDIVVSKADKVIGVYVKKGSSRFMEMPNEKALEEIAIAG